MSLFRWFKKKIYSAAKEGKFIGGPRKKCTGSEEMQSGVPEMMQEGSNGDGNVDNAILKTLLILVQPAQRPYLLNIQCQMVMSPTAGVAGRG